MTHQNRYDHQINHTKFGNGDHKCKRCSVEIDCEICPTKCNARTKKNPEKIPEKLLLRKDLMLEWVVMCSYRLDMFEPIYISTNENFMK